MTAPPCSTLQAEEDEAAAGRSWTKRWGIASSHKVNEKKNTGAGSGPSEHWVVELKS